MKELDQVVLFKANNTMGEGKRLARAHEAERNPTFVVLEADGKFIGKWSGYEKEDFLKSLKDLLGSRAASSPN